MDWLQSVELRRLVHSGLTRGEARNALARAVFLYRLGEIRDRSFETAIVPWNTVYLDRATNGLRGQGQEIDLDPLQYRSPLGWEHINLTGDHLRRSNAKI